MRIENGEPAFRRGPSCGGSATIAGLHDYLLIRGDAGVSQSPVPRGLAMRRPGQRAVRGGPLIRAPHTCFPGSSIPRAGRVDGCTPHSSRSGNRGGDAAGGCGAARSWACGSRICAQANVVSSSQRAKTVIRRIVPISARFFTTVAAYLDIERPRISAADRVFVVLKGPRRGQPLSAAGLDEIVACARRRAGIERLTCHQLRHTCFTRLREAGMALEAIQAQAGHRPSSRVASSSTSPTTGWPATGERPRRSAGT